MEPIYFSKIEFVETLGYVRLSSNLVIDLVQKELVYQEYEWDWKKLRRPIPNAQRLSIDRFYGETFISEERVAARWVKTGKSDHAVRTQLEPFEQDVVFVWGRKLTDEEYKKLLPYCNVLDFEPYRGRKMSMEDPGYLGYRDEINLHFTGITDSYIPKLDLPMNYYYDEKHMWPCERLFRYVTQTFLNTKKMRGKSMACYGAGSLFC
jgi:hypothetical protein